MPDQPPPKFWHPAWVSSRGRVSLVWGAPCDRPSEAQHAGQAEIAAGRASLAFVVEVCGGERVPLASYTSPASARKIVEHWEALMATTEGPAG